VGTGGITVRSAGTGCAARGETSAVEASAIAPKAAKELCSERASPVLFILDMSVLSPDIRYFNKLQA